MGNVLQGRSLKPVDSEQGIDKGTSLSNHHNVDNVQNGSFPAATSSPPQRSPLTDAMSAQLSGDPLQTSMELVTSSLIKYNNSLKDKNRRIDELASKLNKLTSVFQQHLLECETWKKNPPAIAQHLSEYSLIANRSPSDYDGSGSITPLQSQLPPLSPFATGDILHAFNKRLGVSAEPAIETVEIKYYDKTAKSRQEIRNALRNNEYLKNFNAVQLQEMVSCMYPHKVAEGCYIIKEGEDGHHLYVAEDGEFQIWQGGKYLTTIGPGNCFGELALICNTKRTASVKAVTDARIWVLERKVFQVIMMKTSLKEMEARVNFLSSVPLLKNLERSQLQRIGDVLEAQYHPAGECIIRQGELADSFFIIQSGEVRVTMRVSATDGTQDEVEIRKMTKGEYFGEKALLGEGRRTANCYSVSPDGVALLCLYRKDFLELMGNFENLEHKEYLDQVHFEKGLAKGESEAVKNDATVTLDRNVMRVEESVDLLLSEKEKAKSKKLVREFEVSTNLKLSDLERVAVIGQGGFGSVELVRPKNDTTISFALKRMKKMHIVETKQQDHVHSEKRIMMAVDHVFICKLFKTYKDNKFVYMLMEFCPGGELWTVLRDRRSFDDKLTRFSLACVIEAFDYLHNLSIIYRDLKPENMLLTTNGYIKLCDFGFAKRLGSQRKTWTFCGTPEYVAPEVILNKGHDFAADYWSLGILTCELLIGTPPFQASEPIKIYMKALRGIDAYDLSHHKNISAKAYQFIRKLCRTNPTERLGTGRLGIQELRSHKYFQGFDWDRVRNCTFQSPFKPKVSGPLDFSNFDQFPVTVESPPDELSGWDKDF